MSESKAALVVGGSSGIGRAAVELLAQAGWRVTLADRDEASGLATVEALTQQGGQVQFVPIDVCDEDSVREAVARAVSAHGPLLAAINSAGVPQLGRPVHEIGAAEWDQCSDINLRGMFLCVKHQVRAMWAQRRGAIVAISSAAATKGLLHSAAYCASKAGVTGLVRGAALDCAEQGIRINGLLPGATETPLAARSSASNPALAGKIWVPVARMAQPREIAAAAVWLVSDDASYITGSCLAADGGLAIC